MGELENVVWDLEYSALTDDVWLVSGSHETAALYRASGNEIAEAAKLPEGRYDGVHHKVGALSDGTIVLNEDYALIRYRADGGILSLPFELQADDALPGALDPGNPLPGTWVSAFGVGGDSIYISRNNLPYLTVVDAVEFEVTGLIPVEARYAGSLRVLPFETSVYLLNADGQVGEYDGRGSLVREWDAGASDLFAVNGGVLVSNPLGSIGELSTTGASEIHGSGWSLLVNASLDRLTTYSSKTGVIETLDAAGRRIMSQQLPDVATIARDPAGGETAPVTGLPPTINDLVVSGDGAVWFVRSDSFVLWKLVP